MVVTLNAKEAFQQLPESKGFREFSATEGFKKALLYGLQHYSDAVTSAKDPQAGAMLHGARQFAQCLLNLTEPVEVPKKTVGPTLNYKA